MARQILTDRDNPKILNMENTCIFKMPSQSQLGNVIKRGAKMRALTSGYHSFSETYFCNTGLDSGGGFVHCLKTIRPQNYLGNSNIRQDS